jgi:four helix bundle protein
MIRRFEDLEVWQRARELAKLVYQASHTQPLRADFGLADQMRRAAVSVGSNIAEGFEYGSRKQQIEACYRAKASAGELRSQAITARDVASIDADTFADLHRRCEECSRMLAAYIRKLEVTRAQFPGVKVARATSQRESAAPAD